jgi:hypothetical protein
VTIALIDDQLLGAVLRNRAPRPLTHRELYTTGYWYVRLCRAVLGAIDRVGTLSGPFVALSPELRERAIGAVLQLPSSIGLLSLRELAPTIGQLRQRHQLNVLGMEALAAATVLRAEVHLSARSPELEEAVRASSLAVKIHG